MGLQLSGQYRSDGDKKIDIIFYIYSSYPQLLILTKNYVHIWSCSFEWRDHSLIKCCEFETMYNHKIFIKSDVLKRSTQYHIIMSKAVLQQPTMKDLHQSDIFDIIFTILQNVVPCFWGKLGVSIKGFILI